MWKEITYDEYTHLTKENPNRTDLKTESNSTGGGVIVDYKTTSDKTPKNYIPMYYKYQLLAYAYIYNKMGIYVDRIRIIWVTRNDVGRISEKTGKPMKDYPSQAVEVTEQITETDLLFIESILKLISESAYTAIKHPELAYLIFKDYRLKKD
jgi:hypothetical protein